MGEIPAGLGTARASIAAVLDLAWTADAYTATEVMAATSLTRSTAIDALGTLVEIGILQELASTRASGSYRGGRPARRFALADDLGVVMGVDAGDTHLTVTVAEPQNGTLVHQRTALDPAQSPAARRSAILERMAGALAESGHSREDLLAICVGVAAPVDRDGVSPPHPQRFWERTNPRLAEALADWAPVVQIKNDAQLAAQAEGARGAAVGCRDFVALLAGDRLGGGVVVDGHPLHGAHGGVGEGVLFDHIIGVGSAFGLRYAVEDQVRDVVDSGTGGALADLARTERIDVSAVLSLAAEGDADAVRVAERVGETLARVVGVLGSVYDPERVIVCGAIAESVGPVIAAARRMLPEQLHLPAPQLLASELGAEVVSLGAVATARRAARQRAVPLLASRRLAERA